MIKPSLIIIFGVPGSGKSSVCEGITLKGVKQKGLVESIGAVYLEKDSLNDIFSKKRHGDSYSKGSKKTYEVIDEVAKENLKLNQNVVINSTFSKDVLKKKWAEKYFEIAKEHNAKLKIVRCILSESELKSRLIKRGYARDKWKLEDWDDFLKKEPIHVPLPYGGIEADTSLEYKKVVEKIIDFVNN